MTVRTEEIMRSSEGDGFRCAHPILRRLPRAEQPAKRCRMPRIPRRDFLNGVALTVASGLTPAAQVAADPARYPPALTGLRGQHEGSFEVAHAVGRAGRRFPIDSLPVEESYDLVVIGGGLSGHAAAECCRRSAAGRPRP